MQRLGVPIGGWSRIQVNLEARKADAVPFMGRVQDGSILPIMWIEVGIDDIPESVMNILYHAHYTANTIESCLQWGSLIGLLASTIILVHILNKIYRKKPPALSRNISGQDRLLETVNGI